jgi:hypothetical protein
LSVGWTIVSWISFILSESDHRMSYVEPWAERHVQTLQALLPEAASAKDFNDDRLGDVLRDLSNDAEWAAIQQSRGVLPAAGVLYIGDSKMEALPLRGRVDSMSKGQPRVGAGDGAPIRLQLKRELGP